MRPSERLRASSAALSLPTELTGSVTNDGPEGIYVLAGPNGAGKSSILGRVIEASDGHYFNPDEATEDLLKADPILSEGEANALVWQEMVRLLRQAISERRTYAFETTLGGETIYGLLQDAADLGIDVYVWYIALASADLHVERVRQRVSGGGHDIPEHKIRARYNSSRLHLVELIPVLKELWVFDNTAQRESDAAMPEPVLLLHMADTRIVEACELKAVPEWAKSIVLAALQAEIGE